MVASIAVACGTGDTETRCQANEDCDDYLACVDGACVDLCQDLNCATGRVCVRGECYAENCTDRSCPEGMICVSGECVARSCAAVSCEAGTLCADGMCHPTDCHGISCGIGVCVGGECVSRSCVGVDCPPGTACARGECYPTSCQAACLDTEVCLDDECVEAACVRVSCAQGFYCSEGQCLEQAGDECDANLTLCSGECVDTSSDFHNCGGCGIVCAADQACLNGQCTGCEDGAELCNNMCVDTQTDRGNCGACGNTCGAQEICLEGRCEECAGGMTRCDDSCVDTQADTGHCGACGNGCAVGQICDDGVCTTPPFSCTPDGNTCHEHETCYSLQSIFGSEMQVEFVGCGTREPNGLVDPFMHTTMITLLPCKDYGEIVRMPWHATVFANHSYVQGRDISSCPQYSTGEYLIVMESNFRCGKIGSRCVSLIEKEPHSGCKCSVLQYTLSEWSDNRPGSEDNPLACGPDIFEGSGQALAYAEVYADQNCHFLGQVRPYQCYQTVGYAHYADNGLCGD